MIKRIDELLSCVAFDLRLTVAQIQHFAASKGIDLKKWLT